MGARGWGNQEWGGKGYLTGLTQVFWAVVCTCWERCQLSQLVLAPSATLVGSSNSTSHRHSAPKSRAPRLHPHIPPHLGQLLLSLTYRDTVPPGYLGQKGRVRAARDLSLQVCLGSPGQPQLSV